MCVCLCMFVCVCIYIQSFENIDFSVTVLLLLPSHLAEGELQPRTQASLCVYSLYIQVMTFVMNTCIATSSLEGLTYYVLRVYTHNVQFLAG